MTLPHDGSRTPRPMIAIELRDATLALGGRVVLDRISIGVGEGEFVGVLGPNGAGKTTLFRALLGLVPPREGSVLVLGRPASPGAGGIGYMPQVRTPPAGSRLSGRSFVASAVRGERWGLPLMGDADRAEVARVLALVGASALADRPLALLSGGERQRLLLAQALLGRPRLLLLDEPLMSLDPRRQVGVVELVRRIGQELGITVLLSAHDLNPLLGAMDRVLYLGGGAAAVGAVEEVVTGPVLSRLYGTEIQVLRAGGRIFVLAGGQQADQGCAHPHGNWTGADGQAGVPGRGVRHA